jgi:hypothetical protein
VFTLISSAAESRVHGDRTMAINGVSAASILNAAQSPLLSLGQTKHRKHPSMTDAETQNASAVTPPAIGGQPGSKVNVTA